MLLETNGRAAVLATTRRLLAPRRLVVLADIVKPSVALPTRVRLLTSSVTLLLEALLTFCRLIVLPPPKFTLLIASVYWKNGPCEPFKRNVAAFNVSSLLSPNRLIGAPADPSRMIWLFGWVVIWFALDSALPMPTSEPLAVL